MNQFVSEYLKVVLSKVKYKKYHPYLAQELNDHIESLKEEYIESGINEEEAYHKAVREMGDPNDLGEKMHKLHRPRIEWSIICIVIAFLAFNLYLLSGIDTYTVYGTSRHYFQKQILLIGAGIIVFAVFYFMNYQAMLKARYVLYGIAMLIILYTSIFGLEINGMRKWIRFHSYMVPIEGIITPLFMIAIAGFLTKWAYTNWVKTIVLGVVTVFTIFIVAKVSMLQGVILTIAAIAMYLVTLMKQIKDKRIVLRTMIILFAVMGVISLVVVFMKYPYLHERIYAWLCPSETERGYRYIIFDRILKNSVWTGLGSQTTENWDILLFDISDFTFTYIISKFGILVAIIVASGLLVLIERLYHTAHTYRETFGRIIMYGIATYFMIQFIIGLLVNMNLFPSTSCPIPFVSYNGITMLFNMACLGLFLGIYRRRDILPEKLLTYKMNKEKVKHKNNFFLRGLIHLLGTSEQIDSIQVTYKDRSTKES